MGGDKKMNEFTDFKTYKMKDKKIYQYVFDYFSEQILSGELKINDKILPEREIAEKLDVSRNSIRELFLKNIRERRNEV